MRLRLFLLLAFFSLLLPLIQGKLPLTSISYDADKQPEDNLSDHTIRGLCIMAYLSIAAGAFNTIPILFNEVDYILAHSKQYFSHVMTVPEESSHPSPTTAIPETIPTSQFSSLANVPFEEFAVEIVLSNPEDHYTILEKYGLDLRLKLQPPSAIIIPFYSENLLGQYFEYVSCGFPFGAVIGSLIVFIFKNVEPYHFLLASAILYTIGSLIVFLTCNTIMTLIGRIIIGVGTGFSSVAPSYMYQLNALAKGLRPDDYTDIAMKFLNNCPYVYPSFLLLCAVFYYFIGSASFFSWRLINIFTAVISITSLLFSCCLFSPPLKRQTPTVILLKKESFVKVIFGKGLHSLLIMVFLHIFQQFTLINIVFFYANEILPNVPYLGIILTAVNVVSTAIHPIAKECIDIAYLGIASGIGCGVSSIILAIGLAYKKTIPSMVGVVAFIIFFAFGCGPLPWVIATNITDMAYSDSYVGIGALFNWISFLFTFFFVPSLKRSIEHKIFYISGAFSFLFGSIFMFVRPLNGATGFYHFGITRYTQVKQDKAKEDDPPKGDEIEMS